MITAIVFGATGVALIQAPAQAVVPAASPAVGQVRERVAEPAGSTVQVGCHRRWPRGVGRSGLPRTASGPRGRRAVRPHAQLRLLALGGAFGSDPGAYLGPTIEAKKGAPIQLTVTNKLEVGTPAVQNPEDCTAAEAC